MYLNKHGHTQQLVASPRTYHLLILTNYPGVRHCREGFPKQAGTEENIQSIEQTHVAFRKKLGLTNPIKRRGF